MTEYKITSLKDLLNIHEKIGDHKIFESPYVEDGKIIFVNSNKINNYGY